MNIVTILVIAICIIAVYYAVTGYYTCRCWSSIRKLVELEIASMNKDCNDLNEPSNEKESR